MEFLAFFLILYLIAWLSTPSPKRRDNTVKYSSQSSEWLIDTLARKYDIPDSIKANPDFEPLPDDNPMFMSAQAKATYLQSIEWRTTRSMALARANNQCEHCHSTKRLEAHHTSYLHLGKADTNELAGIAILCRSCHQRLHNKLGYDRTTYYPISILKEN